MGQKVNPYGFRLGIIRDTRSKWFAEGRDYRNQLVEDLRARKMIAERHHHAGISDVIIERAADTTTITIESAKPGIIIGRGGSDVDKLRRDLDAMMGGRVRVNVEETKRPETRAQLIAEEIASQIERRASIRRAMGQAIERAMRVGVHGIWIAVSGRLMGAEIARTERVGPEGSVPLHTLRADVERGFSEAVTGYGHIGVQVYVCNGIILPPPPKRPEEQVEAEEVDLDAELVVTGEEAVAEAPADDTAQAEAPVEERVEAEELEAAAEATPAEAVEPAAEPAEAVPAEVTPSEVVAEEAVADEELAEIDDLLAEDGPDASVSATEETKTAEEAPVEAAEAVEAEQQSEDNAEEDAGDVDA